ncbi:MAG TPA: hypothetical protein VKV74_12460 [Bryobacteraceae bacterium]|nr:hypothetical protein [Bryobacteraceae bacterium]
MSVWFAASLPPESPLPERDPGAVKQESISPPVPVIFESSELEKMSLRVYSAIHLRVPDSGLDWLDRMIERSRQLDARGD